MTSRATHSPADEFDRKLKEASETRPYKYRDARRGWQGVKEDTLAPLGYPIQEIGNDGEVRGVASEEYALTDLGNAHRLAAECEDKWINVRSGSSVGDDLVYGGGVWLPDVAALVDQYCRNVVDSIVRDAAECADPHDKKRLLSWVLKCQHRQRFDAMKALGRCMPEIVTPRDHMDRHDYLLCAENVTIDLRTGKPVPHDPAHLLTKRVEVTFDPAAECKRFLRFLDEITGGDAELIGFLQRLTGYCLTGDVREQVLPIFIGRGANGKSTFVDLLMSLLGEYAAPAPPSLLTARTFDPHPCEVAALQGKRLVVASEFEEGRSLRASFVKAITGDAYLTGRGMRENFYRFRRTHKTLLIANVRPRITEQTDAIWRRLLIVPFDESFIGREDKELPGKLAAELPGVLRWSVEGCLAWQREGLNPPARIADATAGYRSTEDTLPGFIEDCLVVADGARISRTEVFRLHGEWARANKVATVDAPVLYERLRARGHADDRWKHAGEAVRGFRGIGARG